MRTQVVNLRKCRTTSVIRIDRLSVFGNPFRIGKNCSRKQSLKKYRKYFYNRIKTDKKFRWAVESLKGHILACWCKPLPCHGDIIGEYLEKGIDK